MYRIYDHDNNPTDLVFDHLATAEEVLADCPPCWYIDSIFFQGYEERHGINMDDVLIGNEELD